MISEPLIRQVDELLKQRDNIHSSFSVNRTATTSGSASGLSNGSGKFSSEDLKADQSPGEEGSSEGKDKSGKKKWFNLNIKGSEKKVG